MSTTNRPTSRWSSSTKSSHSINQIPPIQKKFHRPLINNQHGFAQRAAKTRHDVEQLFKLYYSTNIKFDTFQRQVVTGTRIPSARTLPLIQNPLTNSSSDVFHSKHCVSREQISPLDINEQQIINIESKQLPIKRTVQVRIDNNPITCPSPELISTPKNSDLIVPENPPSSPQQDEFNESLLVKSIEDIPTDFLEHNHSKKLKSTITTLPPIPSSNNSLINNRKDLTTLSHSSFSTINSLQQPNIVTGTAVNVRERSPTKSTLHKPRIKSSCQQSNLKTSPVSIQYDQPEFPVCLGARVVSIPSKCSRYVLLTFPQAHVRYNVPTYVERLLLSERFPTLFQNIVHNRNNN